MPKNYEASKVQNLLLRIKFSTPSDPVEKDGEYFAAVQRLQCVARNGSNIRVPVNATEKHLGVAKDVPWTAKEVGDAIKNFNNFNTAIYNDLKAIWMDAISEDIST